MVLSQLLRGPDLLFAVVQPVPMNVSQYFSFETIAPSTLEFRNEESQEHQVAGPDSQLGSFSGQIRLASDSISLRRHASLARTKPHPSTAAGQCCSQVRAPGQR